MQSLPTVFVKKSTLGNHADRFLGNFPEAVATGGTVEEPSRTQFTFVKCDQRALGRRVMAGDNRHLFAQHYKKRKGCVSSARVKDFRTASTDGVGPTTHGGRAAALKAAAAPDTMVRHALLARC
ncbi:unnamed protein product [Heligmosomoides polygyrus]|uniref:Peptidyl-prolyl cis-trans isomerase n=1 Tax=Heligmosomoides polygyrus TaxID=6339 RepID=A0A183G232_HELPZ|nr:unnamed protein product [Heligmosomoides polygyrus]